MFDILRRRGNAHVCVCPGLAVLARQPGGRGEGAGHVSAERARAEERHRVGGGQQTAGR